MQRLTRPEVQRLTEAAPAILRVYESVLNSIFDEQGQRWTDFKLRVGGAMSGVELALNSRLQTRRALWHASMVLMSLKGAAPTERLEAGGVDEDVEVVATRGRAHAGRVDLLERVGDDADVVAEPSELVATTCSDREDFFRTGARETPDDDSCPASCSTQVPCRERIRGRRIIARCGRRRPALRGASPGDLGTILAQRGELEPGGRAALSPARQTYRRAQR